ncbi:MAG: glutathione S-transferase family protein [Planctomycetota bacterium]
MALTLFHLPPSPNNLKVALALGFKRLPFEELLVDRADRSAVVEASGQPLTPVLVHDGHVVYDSSAILRYLDANFRDTPPLFSPDRTELKDIEGWERYHWTALGRPLSLAFAQAFGGDPDPKAFAQASTLLTEATERVELRLAEHDWLVGDRLTAADLFCAAFTTFAAFTPERAQRHPLWQLFHEHYRLGQGRDRTRAWLERVFEACGQA